MKIELSTSEVQFIMDLMMGCPLGFTKDHAIQNNVDDSALFNRLGVALEEVAHLPAQQGEGAAMIVVSTKETDGRETQASPLNP